MSQVFKNVNLASTLTGELLETIIKLLENDGGGCYIKTEGSGKSSH